MQGSVNWSNSRKSQLVRLWVLVICWALRGSCVLWGKLRTCIIQWKALTLERDSSKKCIITSWSEKVSNNSSKRAYRNMHAVSDMSLLSVK